MDWITENWVWIALVVAAVLLYFRGNLAGRLTNQGVNEAPHRVGATAGAEQTAPTEQVDAKQTAQHRRHGCC